VTDSPHRDKPPSLGALHDRALEEPHDAGTDGARRFMAWFDNQASGPAGDSAHRSGAVDAVVPFEEVTPGWRGAIARGLALAACAVGIALMAGHVLPNGSRGRPREVTLSPTQEPAPSGAPLRLPSGRAADDPCRDAVRAGGESPLVDDFEDANELVALLEARNGYWVVVTDTDREASESVLLPSVRPAATPMNRYALHVSGQRRTKWGASVQVELGPTCYDASAYRGIAFDVLGPGRLYAGVRQVDAVPVERGGTCTTDCYDSHLYSVDATSGWTHHEAAWSELHPHGKTEPANPRRLSGIEFLVRPEDTPYELWIDNVAFVP
jgi:hypothetical protein